MIQFPGQASPATAEIAWEAWTTPQHAVRFPGEASPAQVPIRWSIDLAPAPAPAEQQPRPPVPEPIAASPPMPTPASAIVHTGPLPVPPTDLLTALATAQDAVASAHTTYLAQHEQHLAAIAALQATLTRVLDEQIRG